MPYGVLVTVHLLCAIVFGGAVAFEVLILPALQQRFSRDTAQLIDGTLEARAMKILPWVVVLLYVSGVWMLLTRFPSVDAMLSTHMGRWLAVKVSLALVVLATVATALTWVGLGRMTPRRVKIAHRIVLTCIVAIVIIAKAMLYL